MSSVLSENNKNKSSSALLLGWWIIPSMATLVLNVLLLVAFGKGGNFGSDLSTSVSTNSVNLW